MPVGVVPGDALAQPEHFADAEIVLQRLLDLSAPQLRIPVPVEQAGFRRQKQPLPVHVDRAALEHHVDGKPPQPQSPRDPGGNPVVEVERRILAAPSVVHPVSQRDFAGADVSNKDRPMIATPAVVGGMIEESNPGEVSLRFVEQRPGASLQRPGNVDAHLLVTADDRDDLRECGGNRTKMAGPGLQPVRPRQPHRRLRLPLRRHAKTEGGRRWSWAASELSFSRHCFLARDRA